MKKITEEAKAAYADRNSLLKDMGFSSYKVYIQSNLWYRIRHGILGANTRCRACGAQATQLHHNRYTRADLDGTCTTHLIPVCGACHKKCEFTKIGVKVDPKTATHRLDDMRRVNQKRWQEQDRADCWKHFFTVLTDLRIYLGMDESFEARTLVERLDAARLALPKKPMRRGKKKSRSKIEDDR